MGLRRELGAGRNRRVEWRQVKFGNSLGQGSGQAPASPGPNRRSYVSHLILDGERITATLIKVPARIRKSLQ